MVGEGDDFIIDFTTSRKTGIDRLNPEIWRGLLPDYPTAGLNS